MKLRFGRRHAEASPAAVLRARPQCATPGPEPKLYLWYHPQAKGQDAVLATMVTDGRYRKDLDLNLPDVNGMTLLHHAAASQ